MRKFLLIIGILIYAMSVQAQEANVATSVGPNRVKLSEKLLKKCEKLMADAQWYLKRKEFGRAKEKLTELIEINPKDAQAKVLLEQCEEYVVQYGESSDKKPKKFTFGLTVGADLFKLNYGIHIGLAARYGHYTDLINVTAGLEFEVHQSYRGRADVLEDYTSSVTIGGQAILPVLVKFNVAKINDVTRFYTGAGAEFGVKVYAKNINISSFIGDSSVDLMNGSTVAGLLQVGVMARHYDVGLYYRHYFNDLVNKKFPSYQENDRIGVTATYYF